MKYCKTFCEGQTASLSTNPPPNQIKSYYASGTNIFLREIYRNTLTFAFKVLQECSYGASRNDAVRRFFLTPNRKILAEKFLK